MAAVEDKAFRTKPKGSGDERTPGPAAAGDDPALDSFVTVERICDALRAGQQPAAADAEAFITSFDSWLSGANLASAFGLTPAVRNEILKGRRDFHLRRALRLIDPDARGCSSPVEALWREIRRFERRVPLADDPQCPRPAWPQLRTELWRARRYWALPSRATLYRIF